MKKYSKPEIFVVKIETQNMIAESLNMTGNKGNYSGNQLSRESNWTDED